MLTPITKPETRSFTFLAHFFPLTTTGIPLRLAIKGGQAMLLGIDWAWSGEWMQAMRQQFDLPKLQLWIAPSLSEAAAHLSAGTYLLTLEDQHQELPVLISTVDERKVFVLAQEVDLYYEGWPERI